MYIVYMSMCLYEIYPLLPLRALSHLLPLCSSPVIRGSSAAMRMSRVSRCSRLTREKRAANILAISAFQGLCKPFKL